MTKALSKSEKSIIGLWGTSNVGKSQTIKAVYSKLIKKYPNYKYHPSYTAILNQVDISVVIEINGKIIGIESQGDPKSRLFVSLPIFVKLKCDIILCATRTRGKTVKAVEKYQNDYGIIWEHKVTSTRNSEIETDNEEMARKILRLINSAL